jgi:hypothetical protein
MNTGQEQMWNGRFHTQGVSEWCEQILGTSSTYQNKKNDLINMYPETFNLRIIAERVCL